MESPLGRLVLVSNDTNLKEVTFSEELIEESEILPEIMQRTVRQLGEYFEGMRFDFDLDLDPDGTEFQKAVWQLLLKVPFGATKSYRDLALESGSVLNTRAVGTANGKNPIAIIVPCHRIIGSDGKMVGYAGGLERKKWLLLHEAELTKNGHQNPRHHQRNHASGIGPGQRSAHAHSGQDARSHGRSQDRSVELRASLVHHEDQPREDP